MDDQQKQHAPIDQIDALLNLSQDKNFDNRVELSPKKGSDLMNVKINPGRATKFINWPAIGSFLATIIFLLSVFVIRNPLAVSMLQQVSLLGLILIVFGGPLSRYTGTMWTWGHVGTKVTQPSPAFLVKLIGWILLLIPITYDLYQMAIK
ncbi:MAG TPA: hypothetical protein VE973_01695 [Candidatus Limnocylindria bacterium]|nr:hypothetical protein [Candidatus Limnocylindria bacterium]